MATNTPNLNLKKPGYTDPVDVQDFNDNFDKIDAEIAGNSSQIGSLSKKTESIFSVKEYGAKGDLIADDTTSIQNAINAARDNGGGIVFIPCGTYLISSTLTLYPFVTVEGIGRKSVIQTSSDIEVFTTQGVIDTQYFDISLKNFKIKYTGTSCTKYQIHIINPVRFLMYHVEIEAPDMTLTDTSGVHIDTNISGTVSGLGIFLAEIDHCWIRNGSVILDISDSKVHKSWMWSHTRQFGIELSNAAGGISIEDCDIVPSPTNGGIWFNNSGSPYSVNISNVYFDGSYDSITTGHGIFGKLSRATTIIGCKFIRCGKSGIYITEGTDVTITGNVFLNNNRQDGGHSDIVIAGTAYGSNRIAVTGNSFRQEFNRTNKGYAVEERNTGFNPDNNVIIGNTVNGNTAYLSPSIKRLGTGTTIANNRGSLCKSENSGTGTIASGSTTATIAHGLGYTPAAKDITITPTNNLGSAKVLYVTTIDATNFVVRSDVDPGATTATFSWSARIV